MVRKKVILRPPSQIKLARERKKIEAIQKQHIAYPELGAIYQHYKGGKYKVLYMARHSENKQVLVIYQSLQFGDIHARPLSMWFDAIVDTSMGKIIRFTKIINP